MNFGFEARRELTDYFGDKLRVFERFSHLHDTHNGRLDEHLSVFFDIFMRLFVLWRDGGVDGRVAVDSKLFAFRHATREAM